MTSECSIKDLADTIQSRLTKEANSMSYSMIQSITATLTDTRRHLYEVLNSQQPLFKLPNEILGKIARSLTCCPMDDISDMQKKPMWRSTIRDPIILLPVTQTCRRLRQVIVADTTLWRHNTTRNRDFLELSLSRSGPLHLLTLWLSPRTPTPMPLTDFHFQLAPRLRELHFHNCIPKNIPGMKSFLLLPFPQLESFSWTGEVLRTWSDWHDGMLPSSGLSMPNIRYLHVQQIRMLLPTTDLHRLTHLCLSSFTEAELPTLVDNVLWRCRALTSLILRKPRIRDWFETETESVSQPAQPLHLPRLSRVVLADMDFTTIRHFARLFASLPVPCMQIILTDEAGPLYAYPREFFADLYLQYWRSGSATDTSRLSIVAHAAEDHLAPTGISVTLANSTRVLHVSVSSKALAYDLRRSGECMWSERRINLLAPLRALPDLREVWLTDMHVDTFMSVDALPFSGAPSETGSGMRYGQAQARALTASLAPHVPALETIVVVYNCSARGCRNSLAIRPTLVALPKGPSRPLSPNPTSTSSSQHTSASPLTTSGAGSGAEAAPPPLVHLILAVGYDAADAANLHDTWESALLPGRNGQVEVSPRLLREAAMEEYAYVRHAALRVQLMPRLALAPGELERLRECFAAVDVEEIDCIPRVPVPAWVGDEMLEPGGFAPGSMLC